MFKHRLRDQTTAPLFNISDIPGSNEHIDNSEELAAIWFRKRYVSSSLFASFSPPIGDPENAFGQTDATSMMPVNELQVGEQSKLETIYRIVISKLLKQMQLERAPPWLLEEAVPDKISINWAGAYISKKDSEMFQKTLLLQGLILFTKLKRRKAGKY